MKTPREKYNNDKSYKTVVGAMCAYVYTGQYTQSEMREAVDLACVIYEEHITPMSIPKDIDKLNVWTQPC